jgi:hypothetical protein
LLIIFLKEKLKNVQLNLKFDLNKAETKNYHSNPTFSHLEDENDKKERLIWDKWTGNYPLPSLTLNNRPNSTFSGQILSIPFKPAIWQNLTKLRQQKLKLKQKDAQQEQENEEEEADWGGKTKSDFFFQDEEENEICSKFSVEISKYVKLTKCPIGII